MQLSLFPAPGGDPPAVTDLGGLLAGPGQVVRSGDGLTARVSVVLPDLASADWRTEGLLAAFVERGLGGGRATSIEGLPVVRTDFTRSLRPLALAWARGAVKAPPAGFALDGSGLRLWVLAAGHPDGSGYLLPLGEADLDSWEATGAALASVGLAATLLGPRGGGPAYRVTGRRRSARLRELVGAPPPGADGGWPAVPTTGHAVRSSTARRPGRQAQQPVGQLSHWPVVRPATPT